MNKHTKLYSVISYITWIGWILALLLRDKDDAMVRHHLNQALILNIASLVCGLLTRIGGLFGTVGTLLDIAVFVLCIMGIVRAAKLSDEPLPVIGQYHLIN